MRKLPLATIALVLVLTGVVAVLAGAFDRGGRSARAASVQRLEALGNPPDHPNVVVIETDDQTVEQMKVLRKTQRLLADQGATFDNSFVSLSLCCPSRATFLTGQYAHNHGVVSNVAPDGGYQALDSARTLPVWMTRAGYKTAFVGKYLNGYGQEKQLIPPGWQDWHALLDFSYFNYKMNDNGRLHGYGHRADDYQTDVFTRKAVDVIHRQSTSTRPLFLWVSYFAPHAGGPNEARDPLSTGTPHPAPRYAHAFDRARLPHPASLNEADVSDKPSAIKHRPLLTPTQLAEIRIAYQQQLEALLSVDDGVAAIVRALKQTGELDDTLIIFTDDNGIFHGEHRVPSGKVLLYEPAVRVPLLMRGPGIPAGIHLDQMAANIDLAPTILSVAHFKPRNFVMDGRSLLPIARHPATEWGRDLLIERLPQTGEAARSHSHRRIRTYGEIGNGDGGNQGRSGTPKDRAFDAIRTPRYLYAEYSNGAKELYDLSRDPDELDSVHADPAYAVVERDLARRLGRLRTCAGAACKAGPRVSLSVATIGRSTTAGGRCSLAKLRARVGGADDRWVKAVRYYSHGRVLALAHAAPFTAAIQRPSVIAKSGRARIRARIVFSDGRKVDRTRTVTAFCR